MTIEPEKKVAEKADASNLYYLNVILPDERRFLVSEAKMHIKRVDFGTVTGDRKVIIENGKAMVDCNKEVVKLWNQYVEDGEKQEE